MKSNLMSPKEKVYLGFKLALRTDKNPVNLKCRKHGNVNYNPEKLGKHIDYLPACLGGTGMRVMEDTDELRLIKESLTINDLVACYPKQYQFYPTDAVMQTIV